MPEPRCCFGFEAKASFFIRSFLKFKTNFRLVSFLAESEFVGEINIPLLKNFDEYTPTYSLKVKFRLNSNF